MFDDAYFLCPEIIQVDAAIVGISRERWKAINRTEATIESAMETMAKHRFDVLPMVDRDSIREYFMTKSWNDYSEIEQKEIRHTDVIPLDTRIRDVIKGFATDGRHFYFLSNGIRIAGLISIVNLNCRAVKVYLFGLLSELEMKMGRLLRKSLEEGEIERLSCFNTDEARSNEAWKSYRDARANGLDVSIVEYLQLKQMVTVLSEKKDLQGSLGYQSKSSVGKHLRPLVDLRHKVAHPVRPTVTDIDSVEGLWRQIDRIEDALFRLRQLLGETD